MIHQDVLENLKKELIIMARSAEKIYEMAVPIIWSRDTDAVASVRELDREIDQKEMKIDEMCIGLLLKEPYAHDLRLIVSAIKNIKELERIGDQSKTVAKWALKLSQPVPPEMRELVEKTREALSLAIQALAEEKTEIAEKVMELEFQVDEIEDRIIEKTTNVAEAFIAKAIERIGDLATNIAENVIFSKKAEDVRHGNFQ
ncbi:MAG: hypothetical protein HS115_04230 [Spirochaetales bacterium]|nr:hypothetical protein [Spirochaetales bacterium]